MSGILCYTLDSNDALFRNLCKKGDNMGTENEESVDAGNPEQRQRYRVMADYQASYPDPFCVTAGETFQVSEKVDAWNSNPDWIWVWCTDKRGKQGWVPKHVITFNSDGITGTTRSTYTATELTVAVEDELVAHQEESGWVWCTNHQGKSGWVPLDHITLLS
jgi:uncharacterized protein YgiM (DUF1202 family)